MRKKTWEKRKSARKKGDQIIEKLDCQLGQLVKFYDIIFIHTFIVQLQ